MFSFTDISVERRRIAGDDVKEHLRVFARQPVNRRQNNCRRDRFGRSDADFALGRIGKKIDVLNPLSQVIEDRDAVFCERKTVWCRHDAAPAAVHESNAERMFQLDDGLGNSGLGGVETLCRLSHAAGFNDRQQNIEVTQFQAALGAIVPRHEIAHS
jgi:hypothetical protein